MSDLLSYLTLSKSLYPLCYYLPLFKIKGVDLISLPLGFISFKYLSFCGQRQHCVMVKLDPVSRLTMFKSPSC